jgi:uncharacterized protein YfbU (UPF0304 family)
MRLLAIIIWTSKKCCKNGLIRGKMCYNEMYHMTEKKPVAVEPLLNIEVHATEIPVARSRAVEPYIKTFAFHPENVTQEHLGTLVGVFSVFDRSESSAYTVNVIASVARKEYYANPRRGAIESFESTLHRINLALSELVKNGQTDWMGSLHGAIAVIEKRNIHFSATGDAGIFLFREGTISDIGEGLASEEAAEHPLKTFLEISSGRLIPDDCILLATPELFELFSPRDLERNAHRLLPEKKFTRFLETAMVNELRIGGAIVLDISEEQKTCETEFEAKRPKKRSTKVEPVNAWSEKAFREAAEERTKDVIESYDPERDIVPEPQHEMPPHHEIRIQGEAFENATEHPLVTRFRWMVEDTGRSVRNTIIHSARKTRRRGEVVFNSISETASISTESRRNKPDFRTKSESTPAENDALTKKQSPTQTIPRKPDDVAIHSAIQTFPARDERDRSAHQDNEASSRSTQFKKETFRNLSTASTSLPESIFMKRASGTYIKIIAFLSRVVRGTKEITLRYVFPAIKDGYRLARQQTIRAARKTALLSKSAWSRFLSLPQKRQVIIAAILAFLATGIGIGIWKSIPEKKSEPIPVVIIETPVVVPFPPVEETSASLTSVTTLPSTDQDIVSPVYLGDSLFLVTKNGILDTTTNMTATLPTSDTISLTGGMEDLGLIFLLTDSGSLYSFAPSNHAFTKNNVPFSVGFNAESMGDFLTYLYFLENGTGRIYRFPRTEGGFGEGVLWTKSTMPIDTNHIAVSENIYGAGSVLTAFFRGNLASDFSFQQPITPLSITSVCANSDVSDRIVVLDAPAKRVITINEKGIIISQLFNESFASATACALSGNGSTVAVSGGTTGSTIAIPR